MSGLVRSPSLHGNEPIKGSPLKQSVTPSKLRNSTPHTPAIEAEDGEKEASDDEVDDTQQDTPTKTVKYKVRPGVKVDQMELGSRSTSGNASEKRQRGDTSAFFALRPGGTSSAVMGISNQGRIQDPLMGGELRQVRPRRARREGVRKENELPRRRDWTYKETQWGSDSLTKEHEAALQKVRHV